MPSEQSEPQPPQERLQPPSKHGFPAHADAAAVRPAVSVDTARFITSGNTARMDDDETLFTILGEDDVALWEQPPSIDDFAAELQQQQEQTPFSLEDIDELVR